MCELLGLNMVTVFYEGIFNQDKIHQAFIDFCNDNKEQEHEGYVVRVDSSFSYNDFYNN